MTHVLLAGATGYLGKHILNELRLWGIPTTAIVRSPEKLGGLEWEHLYIKEAQVTNAESLKGLFEDISTVISTVGITRQKEGLTYMEVDYQANANLLEEAMSAGVKKFIYVSVLDGDHLRNLSIVNAKERFVDQLKQSGLKYTVIRPNGFFSDMKDFLMMAKLGRVYLFGKGEKVLNPIHGADLAEVVVKAIASNEKEISVGGPDLLTQNEIAEMAFLAFNKPSQITHLPNWLRHLIIYGTRLLTKTSTYGPIEFFLTLMARENIAPRYGSRRVQDFFKQEALNHSIDG